MPSNLPKGIEKLISSGSAQWQGGKPVGADFCLLNREHSLSDLVLEDR